MPTFKDIEALKQFFSETRSTPISVGLIPTMGALHDGHLALVKTALSQNNLVVVSIFVNPTQFGNAGDLQNYPRTLQRDEMFLSTLQDDIVIFAPTAEDLYNNKVEANTYQFGSLATEMEGQYRVGHFNGVGTVLELLFDVIKPDRAYFGEKDFQQLQVVRKLVDITEQPVEVVGCPIYREKNGLAMSSRNERLTSEERRKAAFIYNTLQKAKVKFNSVSPKTLTDWVIKEFEKQDLIKLEYFEVAEINTLKTIEEKKDGQHYRAFIAAYIGEVRLIDNVALNH